MDLRSKAERKKPDRFSPSVEGEREKELREQVAYPKSFKTPDRPSTSTSSNVTQDLPLEKLELSPKGLKHKDEFQLQKIVAPGTSNEEVVKQLIYMIGQRTILN